MIDRIHSLLVSTAYLCWYCSFIKYDNEPNSRSILFWWCMQVKAILHTQDEMTWLEMRCTVSDQVLGYVLGDSITDAGGHVTHTILKLDTPGVLKTFIMARASGKVALKASRTWLPSHRYWFVPPRTIEYSTGGWYVEWSGGERQGRGGLHPGIACCLLGFQALQFENGVHVPWWLKSTLQAPQHDVCMLPA